MDLAKSLLESKSQQMQATALEEHCTVASMFTSSKAFFLAEGDLEPCPRPSLEIRELLTVLPPTGTKTFLKSSKKMDSHADTCCLGAYFISVYYTCKICNVAPFPSDLLNQERIPICSGATAYDDGNGGTHILIINEAL